MTHVKSSTVSCFSLMQHNMLLNLHMPLVLLKMLSESMCCIRLSFAPQAVLLRAKVFSLAFTNQDIFACFLWHIPFGQSPRQTIAYAPCMLGVNANCGITFRMSSLAVSQTKENVACPYCQACVTSDRLAILLVDDQRCVQM